MGFISDLKIMYHMVCSKNTGANHEQRLENFYSSQMNDYDDFRRRLLHGREQMMGLLPLESGSNLIDMGGGTGNNIEALAPRLKTINSVTIVDLCGSLLNVAKKRIEKKNGKMFLLLMQMQPSISLALAWRMQSLFVFAYHDPQLV